jgi:hypothetical protein
LDALAAGTPVTVTVKLKIAPNCPPQLLEFLQERRNAGLLFRIILCFGSPADPPHAVGLLRARHERPRRRPAPPSPAMNSRLFIRSPRRRLRVAFPAEQPGCLQVDDELELGRLNYRKVCRLGALEDAAGVDADLTKHVRIVARTGLDHEGYEEE